MSDLWKRVSAINIVHALAEQLISEKAQKLTTGGKYGLTLASNRIYDEGGRGEHIDIHLEN